MTTTEQFEYDKGMMSIRHRLALIFHHNKDLIPVWLSSSNRAFGFSSPFDVIADQGLEGINSVIDYLDGHIQKL